MKADLHVHSTASDGTLTPTALVELALREGLDVLAIADHDSVEGLAEALAAAQGTTLTVIPAVELSAALGDRDVHILGYFIDHEDPGLLAHLSTLRRARLERATRTVERLADAGIAVDLEDVLGLAAGGSVGRSHLARALVSRGHAEGVAQAFDRYIGRGRPYYVAKEVGGPADVIGIVRNAGGIAVVAHPGVGRLDDEIAGLAEAGLGGIEAYHADHDSRQRDYYAEMAERMGLFVTGGSDYHGPEAPNPILGSVKLPQAAVERLLSWPRAKG
jgi:3',5'-nucleoside bisphosphate phosphatase